MAVIKAGNRGRKGTLITEAQASAAAAEALDYVIINENNAKAIEYAMNQAMAAALEEIGLAAEGYAKRLCPVDTGRLRVSIAHVIQNWENAVYIGTNVEYAPYVELGTVRPKREGAHFLYNAANDHQDRYGKIARKHLENASL